MQIRPPASCTAVGELAVAPNFPAIGQLGGQRRQRAAPVGRNSAGHHQPDPAARALDEISGELVSSRPGPRPVCIEPMSRRFS